MPKAWNYDLWIQETTVSNTILRGNRERSDPLDALDQALRVYDNAKKTHNVDQILTALSALFDKSDAWKATKSDITKSIRNKGGNFTDFEQWLVAENQKILAPWEAAWGTGSANCYAYAMKCRKDFTGTPVPGRHAGYAVEPGDRGFRTDEWTKKAQELHKRSLEERLASGVVSTKEAPALPSYLREHNADPVRRYHAALFEGIQADAAKDGKTVTVLSDLDEMRRGIYPSPDPLPATRVTSTTYLAAMVVRDGGYHFMRRDNTTGLWSHKNGGTGNAVEIGVHPIHLGVEKRILHPITDTVAAELLKNRRLHYANFGNDFIFAGYLLVPSDGITVA